MPQVPPHYNNVAMPGRNGMIKLCHHVVSLLLRNTKVAECYREEIFQVQRDIESTLRKYRELDGQFIDAMEIVVSARQKLLEFEAQAPYLVSKGLLDAVDIFLPILGPQ